jgi:hypothetical protein
MRVGFLIEKWNYYRLFGPIVERALARGHETECWHDLGQLSTGPKTTKSPDTVPPFPHRQPRLRPFRDAADLAAQLAADAPDVMVALARPAGAGEGLRMRWFGLQYTLDVASLLTPAGATRFDALGLHSRYWADHAADCLRINAFNRSHVTGGVPEPVDEAAVAEVVKRRGVVVGTPEMDQAHKIDPADVRARLGLEPERPVVLYIPFPFNSNPNPFWVRRVYGGGSNVLSRLRVWWRGDARYREQAARGLTDRGTVDAVRAFCDRNGATLVVKEREKDPASRYLKGQADLVLGDEAYYPATILELLRISSLCVHFFSTVAYEAAHAGVPSLCVAPDLEDLGFPPMWREWFLNLDEGNSWNFPGVIYPITLEEVVRELPHRLIADFPLEPAARAQYVERFVGFDDGKSSDRVLDILQSLAEGALAGGAA